MTELTLTVERTINAPQEDVFNAWLKPETLQKFMTPGPGMSVPRAETDPQAGGRFAIVMQGEGGEIPHAGTYREISPHDRIVFTWESPYSVDDSTVTLTFDTVAEGTHVVLTHVRFADETARDNHKGGWTSILNALNAAVAA